MRTSLTFVLCACLPVCLNLPAQETPGRLRISAGVAEGNIIKKVDPVYPEMARIARIQGRVVLRVVVSPEGKVTDVRAVSGHPLLIESALKAVRQWEYRPYVLNGQAVEGETIVEVPFSLLSKEEAAKFEAALRDYRAQEEKCKGLIFQRAYAEAESACATLPELSEKLDPGLTDERVRAYRNIGTAFFAESKFQDALDAFLHELKTARAKLRPEDQELGYAYADTAEALQSTGDLHQASSDYKQAVRILQRNYEEQISDVMKRNYASQLRPVLREYAKLLRQIGNEVEAEKMENQERNLPTADYPQK